MEKTNYFRVLFSSKNTRFSICKNKWNTISFLVLYACPNAMVLNEADCPFEDNRILSTKNPLRRWVELRLSFFSFLIPVINSKLGWFHFYPSLSRLFSKARVKPCEFRAPRSFSCLHRCVRPPMYLKRGLHSVLFYFHVSPHRSMWK